MRAGYGRLTEWASYEAVVQVLQLSGCAVYRLSQARASKQSAGIPDLYVIPPHGWPHTPPAAWIEIKRPGGKLSPAQERFRERCLARGIAHLVGGIEVAKTLLVAWGKVAA